MRPHPRSLVIPSRNLLLTAAAIALLGACSSPQARPDGQTTSGEETPKNTAPVHVKVVGFNDLHGHMEGPSGSIMVKGQKLKAGGLDVMAAHVKKLRQAHKHVTTVVAGDLIGASPLISGMFHDEPTIEAMNLMRLDILAVGNHEFDEGVEEIQRIKRGGCHPKDGCQGGRDSFPGASFDILAANVIVRETGKTLFPAASVRTYGPVKVGYIGLTLKDTDKATNPRGVASVRFLDEADTINAQVKALKAQGVKTFIVVIHEGATPSKRPADLNSCDDPSGPILDIMKRLDPAVVAVVAGHTHQVFNCTVGSTLLTSAQSYGRVLTEIDLFIDPQTGEVVKKLARNVGLTRDLDKDPEMAKLVEGWRATAAPVANRKVGTLVADLSREQVASGESVLGGIIADAQLDATRESGAQLALMNPGGVRAPIEFKSSAAGEGDGVITFAEIHSVQPFSNMLTTVTLSGEQLKALLEEQWSGSRPHILSPSANFSYTWDASKPVGQRVSAITLDGKPIDPGASYRVTVNSFLASGGDGFTVLAKATNATGGPMDLESFASYLKKVSPIKPHAPTRIKVVGR